MTIEEIIEWTIISDYNVAIDDLGITTSFLFLEGY
jgi:hypothetical protein